MPPFLTRLKLYLLLSALTATTVVMALDEEAVFHMGGDLMIIALFALGGFLLAELLLFLGFRATTKRLETVVSAQSEELRKQAIHDELTGLYNRRYLGEFMEKERARARRFKQPMSLVLIDLDHFKAVNDEFGHLVGDHVLTETAALIRRRIRASDLAFRYGGEEFLVIFTGTRLQAALEICEDLRALLESSPLAELPAGRVTASFGATEVADDRIEPLDDMLERADEALYRAKANGRNRVEFSEPPVAQAKPD